MTIQRSGDSLILRTKPEEFEEAIERKWPAFKVIVYTNSMRTLITDQFCDNETEAERLAKEGVLAAAGREGFNTGSDRQESQPGNLSAFLTYPFEHSLGSQIEQLRAFSREIAPAA